MNKIWSESPGLLFDLINIFYIKTMPSVRAEGHN